jgi:hypothetical protein
MDNDSFAQTREAYDLSAAEVSPPQNPPPSAPTEPRAFLSKGGSGNRGGGGGGGSGGRGGLVCSEICSIALCIRR